jgi:hypothetical protein
VRTSGAKWLTGAMTGVNHTSPAFATLKRATTQHSFQGNLNTNIRETSLGLKPYLMLALMPPLDLTRDLTVHLTLGLTADLTRLLMPQLDLMPCLMLALMPLLDLTRDLTVHLTLGLTADLTPVLMPQLALMPYLLTDLMPLLALTLTLTADLTPNINAAGIPNAIPDAHLREGVKPISLGAVGRAVADQRCVRAAPPHHYL